MSNIVALLTDFGTKDHYVGVMKGVILSVNRHAHIVDISHEISAQDVAGAYFLLKNGYRYFPTGTIFVVVVDPGVGTERAIVCVETPDYLFLAPDNGLLGFLERADKVTRRVHVTNRKLMLDPVSSTFHGRDVFAPVAGHLSAGLDLAQLGPEVKAIRTLDWREPEVSKEGVLLGEVVSVDQFGNLVTNISADAVKDARSVEIRVGRATVRELVRTYGDRRKGELVAIVSSSGTLEVAVVKGSAAKKTGAKAGAVVRVTHR
jgi:hypothetical protein